MAGIVYQEILHAQHAQKLGGRYVQCSERKCARIIKKGQALWTILTLQNSD